MAPQFNPQNDFTGTNGQSVGVTYDSTYTNFGLSVYKEL